MNNILNTGDAAGAANAAGAAARSQRSQRSQSSNSKCYRQYGSPKAQWTIYWTQLAQPAQLVQLRAAARSQRSQSSNSKCYRQYGSPKAQWTIYWTQVTQLAQPAQLVQLRAANAARAPIRSTICSIGPQKPNEQYVERRWRSCAQPTQPTQPELQFEVLYTRFCFKFPPVVFHWFSGEGPDKESACFFHTGLTNETHIGMSVDLIDTFNSYILTLIHELGHGIRSKIPFKSDKPGGSHGRHWKFCTSMLFKSITLRENHLAKAIGYSLDLLSYKTEIVRARPNF